MPAITPLARVFRPRALSADQVRTVVSTPNFLWSITGEFTTPGPGAAPRFMATDVRMVNDDGSETANVLDLFDAHFMAHLEEQAAESLADERAEARAFIAKSHAEQDMCDRIDAARSAA